LFNAPKINKSFISWLTKGNYPVKLIPEKGVMLMSDKRKELIAAIKDELSDLTDEQIKRLLQLIKEEQRQSA
jgi:hypothetical protein